MVRSVIVTDSTWLHTNSSIQQKSELAAYSMCFTVNEEQQDVLLVGMSGAAMSTQMPPQTILRTIQKAVPPGDFQMHQALYTPIERSLPFERDGYDTPLPLQNSFDTPEFTGGHQKWPSDIQRKYLADVAKPTLCLMDEQAAWTVQAKAIGESCTTLYTSGKNSRYKNHMHPAALQFVLRRIVSRFPQSLIISCGWNKSKKVSWETEFELHRQVVQQMQLAYGAVTDLPRVHKANEECEDTEDSRI